MEIHGITAPFQGCSHYGSDCSGRLEREHISYEPPEIVRLCAFHNQVVSRIRRILALRLIERHLKGSLQNAHRKLCYKLMLQHRFAGGFPEKMNDACEQFASRLGLKPSPHDWYQRLKIRPPVKPGTIRAHLEPIVVGNPVKFWDWKITVIDSKQLTRALARAMKARGK